MFLLISRYGDYGDGYPDAEIGSYEQGGEYFTTAEAVESHLARADSLGVNMYS